MCFGEIFFVRIYRESFFGSDVSLGEFDIILGNPPFGGVFDKSIEDTLDSRLGHRFGMKVKKETYAFFIVACVDLLRNGGQLTFICSDSILTIPTMKGLRNFLMRSGKVEIRNLEEFSDETAYPMIVLNFIKGGECGKVVRNGIVVDAIENTPNLSWGTTPDTAKLFSNVFLSDYFIASSGMTTGKNELFVREIDERKRITEHLRFELRKEPITVEYEKQRARLGKLSTRKIALLEQAERDGKTEMRLHVSQLANKITLDFPHADYRPYNKANNRIIYSDPTHCIYWKNEGEAVLTYKKTGKWYLRGVGGQSWFGKEGLTWQLVASKFIARYLPSGYILDSGAPCAFLRDGIHRSEMFFVLGWLLSPLANRVLKTVINHTRNIQSKDFERMPYPWWVSPKDRREAASLVRRMIAKAKTGIHWDWKDEQMGRLGGFFEFPRNPPESPRMGRRSTPRRTVFD